MTEDQALARLRDILAQPDFQYDRSTSWWEQLLIAFVSFLYDLVAQLSQNVGAVVSGRTGIIGIVLLVGAVAVLAVLILYLTRSIRLAVRTEARLDAATERQRRERSDQLWQSAQRFAAAGDWPAATRAAYLSALYILDEQAILHVESSLTNREHALRLAREHPDLGTVFTSLVQRYDRLRYGAAPITADAFGELSNLVAQARTTSGAPA